MGYPLTYQRFINRNKLNEGDYEKAPPGWFNSEIKVVWPAMDTKANLRLVAEVAVESHNKTVAKYDILIRALCGDLRRLEKDAIDEQAICKYIADQTRIDPEVVAAVLKEFLAW